MYKTQEGAKDDLLKVIEYHKSRGIKYVIFQRKFSRTGKVIWYSFRLLRTNEEFVNEWLKSDGGYYDKMVEIVEC